MTDQQAGKLPRWGLLLLCALYTLPGLIARDPWRADDAATFGVALTMARGTLADWIAPNLAGLSMPDRGPLPHWIQAMAMQIGYAFNGLGVNSISEHLATRSASITLLFAALTFVWYAAYTLASRQGLQPSDPFEVAANRTDFGRTVADSALLLLMASFGLVARVHETSVDAIQFTWSCLFIWSLARALERPRSSGWLLGLSLAATTLTRGPYLTFGLLGSWLLAILICPPLRWGFITSIWRASIVVVVLVGGWVWAAQTTNPTHLAAWLEQGRMGMPDTELLSYYLRTLPWFFWPTWPIGLWAIWRWRARIEEPIIAIPLALLIGIGFVAVFQDKTGESALLPLIPASAIIAAIGLPTLKRGVVSLVDWFAVISFTVFGFATWAYWIAFLTGTPPAMARSVARIAPGFEPSFVAVAFALGLAASLAWLALIRWRLGRHTSTIWRPVALSCGGLILTWFLLMTLWLPFFNERNTYRDVALNLNRSVNLGTDCVDANIGTTERTSFFYYSSMRFSRSDELVKRCPFLMLKDEGPLVKVTNLAEAGYKLVWQGGRRSMRDERFRLYKKL